ncbi:enoyl-CoA hydratase/isomerase family protein [Kribbia dieselivorans]|uniref:enoyl-CoA hydratase/isomerase family protein n=1 Tax=Kribbia dieselivorans TaxID=331526 RepID=UPI001FE1CFE6|nr:enoyl-CoA hydratase/isomerase family protein [Kribbia dieselivorans]
MTTEPVLYTAEGGIARITLNRPEASNAVNMPLATALDAAVERAAADDDVRVVVISGAGKRFCGGGDLAAMNDADDAATFVAELADVLDGAHQRLLAMAKPVVGRVQGAAAGAGLALALSCDIVITTDSTKFLMAYAGVGLTPDVGSSYLIPRAVGTQRALELALLGKVVVGEEAREWGLATMVVPAESLDETVTTVATQLAGGPPFALGQAKRLMRAESTRAEAGLDEAKTVAAAVATEDAQALIKAFTTPKK